MTTQLPEPPAPADPDGPSDAELITATRAGDPGAYDVLYRRHRDAAHRLARTLVRDPSAADDLVAEAFARVLATLRAGHGPDLAFRAYLLTSLRNGFYDQTRRERRLEVTDDLTPYDKGEPFVDAASEGLERSLAARAFARLPERWQTVLWHTEVEGESPAAVAPLLGLTPNGVSALAYRARERLRQMYLQEHIADTADPGCHWTAERLGAHVRDGLASREKERVDAHLADCAKCNLLFAELAQVNSGLREVLAPLVVGATWAAYLGAGPATKGAAAAGLAGAAGWVARSWHAAAGWVAHSWHAAVGWVKQLFVRIGPRNAAIGGGATAAVVAAVIAALLLTSSPPRHHAAAPAPTHPATQPPGNPPNTPPRQTPPAATPPPATPAPTTPQPTTPAGKPAQPAAPAGYRITPPSIAMGSLTAGDTAGSLPITITHPGTGGTGGGNPVDTFGSTTAPADETELGKKGKTKAGGTGSRKPQPSPGPEVTPPAGTGVPGSDHQAVSGPEANGTPMARPPGDGTGTSNGSGSGTGSGPGDVNGSGTGVGALPAGAVPLVVSVALPVPMTARTAGAGGSGGGWTCATTQGGAVCRHAALGAGQSSTLTLGVSVGEVSGFQAVTVALSGSAAGRATFTVVVAPAGMRAVYAATAADTIASAGNTLVTGRRSGLPLLKGRPCQLNDECSTVAYHGDRDGDGDGRDRDGGASSWARLVLPAGARVVHAELYWSGRGSSGTMPTSVTLRGPFGGSTVTAGSSGAIPYGVQRSADVTALVARGGAGYWALSAGSVPTGQVPGGAYAGWGLVVVLATPGTAVRNVALFDGPAQVGAPITSRLTGGRGGVQVGVVLWDGDRRQAGGALGDDTLSIGTSRTVTDVGHSASASAPEDARDPDWNTLGTDVAAYDATAAGDTRMRLSTGSDQLLVGGLALAGPA